MFSQVHSAVGKFILSPQSVSQVHATLASAASHEVPTKSSKLPAQIVARSGVAACAVLLVVVVAGAVLLVVVVVVAGAVQKLLSQVRPVTQSASMSQA